MNEGPLALIGWPRAEINPALSLSSRAEINPTPSLHILALSS
ncbi:MAG TPA: hypothetical protein VL485_15220 [Ktedonobacteraceae bacterium]|nr:hypothetical protein [Ktedonobacteraceae bacterium]